MLNISPSIRFSELKRPFLIWGVSAIFVLFQFFLQLSSGVIIDSLMRDFTLTAVGASLLASCYYYIYVILQTPAGMLMDRFGPRYLLSVGALICGIGCMIFASTYSVYWAALGRLLMGGGASFAFVGSLYVIRSWFDRRLYAPMVGLSETIGMLGTVAGSIILAELLSHFGWRNCLYYAGYLGYVIAILCYTVVRENTQHKIKPISKRSTFKQRLRLTLTNYKAWLNGLYNGLVFSVVTVFVALWGIPFIKVETGRSLTAATIACNMVFLGAAIGCPIISSISERVKQRRPLLIASALVSMVVTTIIINISMSYSVLLLAFIIMGISCSGYILNFAVANDISISIAKNTYTGFTNALGMGVAPILQPLVGFLLHWIHEKHLIAHHPALYTINEYRFALNIIPFFLFIAAIIAYMLPETYRHR